MLDINYLRMKRIILKQFKKQNVNIEVQSTLSTRFIIENARILINRRKLIIQNDNMDCIILLDFIKKAKVDNLCIEMIGLNSKYILEV